MLLKEYFHAAGTKADLPQARRRTSPRGLPLRARAVEMTIDGQRLLFFCSAEEGEPSSNISISQINGTRGPVCKPKSRSAETPGALSAVTITLSQKTGLDSGYWAIARGVPVP